MNNPLLQLEGLPSFPEIKAEHMLPAIESVVAAAREGIKAILQSEEHSYGSLVHAREGLESRINEVWSPISHMNSVVNSVEIRAALKACLDILTAYSTDMGQNRRLFDAYERLKSGVEYEGLTAEQKKVVVNADFSASCGLHSIPLGDHQVFVMFCIFRREGKIHSITFTFLGWGSFARMLVGDTW